MTEPKDSTNEDSLVESIVLLSKQVSNSRVNSTSMLAVTKTVVTLVRHTIKDLLTQTPHPIFLEGKNTNKVRRTTDHQSLKGPVKLSDVMNVRGLDTSKLNVQPTSNERRKS